MLVNAENADGFADPVQTVITVAGGEEKPVTKPKLVMVTIQLTSLIW